MMPWFCSAVPIAHATTTNAPNAFRIQRTSVTSMNAAIDQRMGLARRSSRDADTSRQPTRLAPR